MDSKNYEPKLEFWKFINHDCRESAIIRSNYNKIGREAVLENSVLSCSIVPIFIYQPLVRKFTSEKEVKVPSLFKCAFSVQIHG